MWLIRKLLVCLSSLSGKWCAVVIPCLPVSAQPKLPSLLWSTFLLMFDLAATYSIGHSIVGQQVLSGVLPSRRSCRLLMSGMSGRDNLSQYNISRLSYKAFSSKRVVDLMKPHISCLMWPKLEEGVMVHGNYIGS